MLDTPPSDSLHANIAKIAKLASNAESYQRARRAIGNYVTADLDFFTFQAQYLAEGTTDACNLPTVTTGPFEASISNC